MQRSGSGVLLTLAIILVLALTGCLGKSSSNPGNGGVVSITLSPGTNLSLNVGGTQVFSASARDASGRTVVGADIRFVVTSGTPGVPAPLSIASNGNACAGSWDQSIAICSPGTSGIALVQATTSGVFSPPTTVYVHQHIDSIQIASAESQPPLNDCFSQGQTWQFKAIAYSNTQDITNTVGPFNWSFTNNGVVTTTPIVAGTPENPVFFEQTTAKSPGITQLSASISGTSSAPYLYTTCLIQAIHLQIGGQAQAGSSITVNSGGSVLITATAVDTLYNKVDFGPLATPPLTWSTTNPEVIAFSTTTNNSISNSATARANLGGATLTASCSPPSCNIGVLPGLPIFASDGILPDGTMGYGSISVDVTSTSKVPTYTVWAATNECGGAPGCSSALFSVLPNTTGANPIGSIVSLPRTPNSMMFNHVSAARVYLGSDQGLMYVDVTATSPAVALVSNSPTPCNVSLCGRVLTISNDGKLVVVADTVSTPSQVYIYNAGTTSATVDLIIPGETATTAAFSPDQSKLFILTENPVTNTGSMYVYSTVDALTSVPIATSATDVKFSSDGSFAYVAGNPAPGNSISAFATCNAQQTQNTAGFPFVTTPGTPQQIFPSPNGQQVFALDPANDSVDVFTTTVKQTPLPDGQFACNGPLANMVPIVNFPQFTQSFDLSMAKGFTPLYAQLVGDGSSMIIVAENVPAVIVLNIADGSVSSVPLARPGFGSSYPLVVGLTPQQGITPASASTDGSQVAVAACDQYDQSTKPPTCSVASVHIVNMCGLVSCNVPPTIGQGDAVQVPYLNVNNNDTNMCNNSGNPAPQCLPNMIAIRPQ